MQFPNYDCREQNVGEVAECVQAYLPLITQFCCTVEEEQRFGTPSVGNPLLRSEKEEFPCGKPLTSKKKRDVHLWFNGNQYYAWYPRIPESGEGLLGEKKKDEIRNADQDHEYGHDDQEDSQPQDRFENAG